MTVGSPETVDPVEPPRLPQPLDAREGPWSEEEWLRLSREGVRIELLDGSLFVSPNPAPGHQRVSRRLANLLDEPAEAVGGETLEGVNVRLRSGRVLIPDLAVFTEPVEQAIVDSELVLMVVEIISPGQEIRDRVLKYDLYATSGIPWYLIVEVVGSRIEAGLHQLVHGRYKEVATAYGGAEIHLEPLDFSFDPAVLLPRQPR